MTPRVAITSWTENQMPPPPGRRYVFNGFARNLPEGSVSYIYVVARRPRPYEGSKHWLVSPMADYRSNGTWTVEWGVPNPPAEAEWIAVLWLIPCCDSGGAAPDPIIRRQGPEAAGVVAHAKAPPSASPR
jgi:hypothetical protein